MRLNLLEQCLLAAAKSGKFHSNLYLYQNYNISQEFAELIYSMYLEEKKEHLLTLWKNFGHIYDLTFVEENIDRDWDWGYISNNMQITEEFVKNHLDREFSVYSLLKMDSISLEFLYRNFPQRDIRVNISQVIGDDTISVKRVMELLIYPDMTTPQKFIRENYDNDEFTEEEKKMFISHMYPSSYMAKFGEEKTLEFLDRYHDQMLYLDTFLSNVKIVEKIHNLGHKIDLNINTVSREFYEQHSDLSIHKIENIDLQWIISRPNDKNIIEIFEHYVEKRITEQEIEFLFGFSQFANKLVQYQRQMKLKGMSAKKAQKFLQKMRSEDILSDQVMEFMENHQHEINLYLKLKTRKWIFRQDISFDFLVRMHEEGKITLTQDITTRVLYSFEQYEKYKNFESTRPDFPKLAAYNLYLVPKENLMELNDQDFRALFEEYRLDEKFRHTECLDEDILDRLIHIPGGIRYLNTFEDYRDWNKIDISHQFMMKNSNEMFHLLTDEILTFDADKIYSHFSLIRWPYEIPLLCEDSQVVKLGNHMIYVNEKNIAILDQFLNSREGFLEEGNEHQIPIEIVEIIFSHI